MRNTFNMREKKNLYRYFFTQADVTIINDSKSKRIINKKTSFFSDKMIFLMKKASRIPDEKGINSLINGYLNHEIILQHKFWFTAAR